MGISSSKMECKIIVEEIKISCSAFKIDEQKHIGWNKWNINL